MSIEQFDETLREAAKGADFGPLDGFGGTGSSTVAKNLPPSVHSLLFERWQIPIQILANWSPGKNIRHFAEACGHNITGDIATLPAK